jgi:hypothetical protein
MEKPWQVFKTLVYCLGYTGACYIIAIWNYNSWVINKWLGQPGFANLSLVMLIVTWFLWTFGIGGILFEGMALIRKAGKGNEP